VSGIGFERSRLDGLMRRAASLDYLREVSIRWQQGGGEADKGEAAATEYKARGCAAEPSQTTCDDRFQG